MARPRRLALLGAAAAAAVLVLAASGEAGAITVTSFGPKQISAGSFYNGATVHLEGTVGEHSNVVVQLVGPAEHAVFNRRGKIAGLIWGGIEHVTFRNAPSLYEVSSSASLPLVAPKELRARFHLGYDTLERRMEVLGTQADRSLMIENFVRLKERAGLYRVVPGGIRFGEPHGGRRAFSVDLALPAATPTGDIEVNVFEFAGGALVERKREAVSVERVGMPAYLHRLANDHGTWFGFLSLGATVAMGLAIDLLLGLKKRKAGLKRAYTFAVRLAGEIRDTLAPLRPEIESPEEVARLVEKYGLFRRLLTVNNELLELLAELEEESSWNSVRHPRVRMGIRALFDGTTDMVGILNRMADDHYFDLVNVIAGIRRDVMDFLDGMPETEKRRLTLQMADVTSETAELVGGKAVNLARIECDLKVHVPPAFIVTTDAYREFVETDGLAGELRTVLAPARADAPDDFRQRCELAQDLVSKARVPRTVIDAIRNAHRASGIAAGEGLAVRSSAAGEDSALSFAGQFETVLNVPAGEVAGAWKRVVRSRFSPRAVFYRRAAGLAEVDTPMAVLVQQMVPSRVSGVLFTRRPEDPKAAVLLIAAAPGLGADVSAGVASADEFVVSRRAPHRVLERRIARKTESLASTEKGGIARVPVPADAQLETSLTDEQVLELAETALAIEHYFGVPQDIEWAADAGGNIVILQARPLRTEKADVGRAAVPEDARILLQGGYPVWPGRAVGVLHVARTPEEEEAVPAGAVLAVPQLLPDCVRVLPRVVGVVVERGTVTGHAASIVREFRVPSLFGAAGALEKLPAGEVVSLDAGGRAVYEGALWPELRGRMPVKLEGRRPVGLPPVLTDKLTRLSGSMFTATWACRSLHDVIRFVHEMAIQSMFDIGDCLAGSPIGNVKRLDCPPPVSLSLIDLGGGLRPEAAASRKVRPEDIVSVPFRGIWRGLGDPAFEARRLPGPGPRAFAAVLVGTAVSPETRPLDAPNYACITDSYLNLNSRQAYHFAIVDAFLSENPNNNHVSIRFKGGGAAPWQRDLRAEFVTEVLRMHGFAVRAVGDLANGWCRGIDAAAGMEKLAMVGHLLRFSAQLDMWMVGRSLVRPYVSAFIDAEAAALAAEETGTAPASAEGAASGSLP